MTKPNLLVIAGHDPSGGAGIQADIEAAAAQGVHAATVLSLLTCQDTTNVHEAVPVASDFFQRCLDTALADMEFAAIKIGVLANTDQVERVAALARAHPDTPLIVDPVLRAAGGGTLANDSVGQALLDQLFALADVVTPNAAEARLLCAGEPDLEHCGARLSAYARAALITGGDDSEPTVVNRRFENGHLVARDEWPRLDGVFHGSGCTLASAIAARRALGEDRAHALAQAQRYTWQTLDAAFAAGRGQRIPGRIAIPAAP